MELTTSRTASTETIETAARLVGVQPLRAAVGCFEMVESEDEEELVAAVGFREEADCFSTHHYALTQAEWDDLSLLIGLVVVRRLWALQGRVRGGLIHVTVDLLEREMPVVALEEKDRNRQRSEERVRRLFFRALHYRLASPRASHSLRQHHGGLRVGGGNPVFPVAETDYAVRGTSENGEKVSGAALPPRFLRICGVGLRELSVGFFGERSGRSGGRRGRRKG